MSARRCGFQALAHRLRSCGTRLHSMWDRPIPGITPASPALAGGVFTTEPPGHILDSSFPHMYLVKEAGIKRPGNWESSATVLAVLSKALELLASASTALGLFPPLRNALLLDCGPPSSSVHGVSEARILEGVPFPSLQDSILKIFSPGYWF